MEQHDEMSKVLQSGCFTARNHSGLILAVFSVVSANVPFRTMVSPGEEKRCEEQMEEKREKKEMDRLMDFDSRPLQNKPGHSMHLREGARTNS